MKRFIEGALVGAGMWIITGSIVFLLAPGGLDIPVLGWVLEGGLFSLLLGFRWWCRS